ncbi:class I SAM-dependent methyltransferase [Novosphingobium sp. TH158]|uniref:class I SAM-dependent methyltransferase n=1 Tax=Novosphingobium sp. TH158 TaxID=2067455 RepID=UPI001304439E|nr:class I SAM-dependent methyltransferase [Novosphingobium sp. TH158]
MSRWLDPRPAASHVHIAYGDYYTHDKPETKRITSPSLIQRIRTGAANDYINARFGGSLSPAIPFARLALAALPGQRLSLDARYRHLPPRKPGARLLDIGCGNGSFLALAEALGWQAEGVEPDPSAVAAAQSGGLTVFQGGVEHYDGREKLFDEISISHVIEHVHDPVDLLCSAHRLLRPGGRLYLATPNALAPGYQNYGPAWRGLEVPRHLLLFSRPALHELLKQCGFARSADIRTIDAGPSLSETSDGLARKLGITPKSDPMREAEHDEPEFITVEAWR